MISNYNSFLIKQKQGYLHSLLEGYLYGTSDFLSRVKLMTSEDGNVGQIAKNIYRMVNDNAWFKDSELKQNFFDITTSDDKVSFLMNNKIVDGSDLSSAFLLPGRNEMKIGKIVNYLCKISNFKCSSKDIEDFVNIYKSKNDDSLLKFRLISGDEISNFYKSKNNSGDSGSLGASCMLDVGEKRFKIYTKNPDKINMLIYEDSDGKILGRALVWNLDVSPCDGKVFMDRIYTNRDSDMYKFIDYAKKEGWMYKKEQTYGTEDAVAFIYNGNVVYGEIKVKVKGDFDVYPFLDTLCFMDKKKKKLSNLSSKNCFWLNDHEDGDLSECFECGGDVIYEDFYGDKSLCSDCSEGHRVLFDKGVKTKFSKFIYNNS